MKQIGLAATITFAAVAWIGVFFPPKIEGTAVPSNHVETVCTHRCPAHANLHRESE